MLLMLYVQWGSRTIAPRTIAPHKFFSVYFRQPWVVLRKIWQYMCENLKILENWAIACTKQKQGQKDASFRNGYMSKFSFVFFFSRDQCRFPQVAFKKLNNLPLVIYMVHDYSFFGSSPLHQHWKHLYLQNFHFCFLRSESNLYFHHPAFGRSGYRLSNSTVIFRLLYYRVAPIYIRYTLYTTKKKTKLTNLITVP
jgi:hypothetical protein